MSTDGPGPEGPTPSPAPAPETAVPEGVEGVVAGLGHSAALGAALAADDPRLGMNPARVRALSSAAGNATVARLLAPGARALQRAPDPPPAAPAGGPAVPAVSAKHTVAFKTTIPVNAPLAPIPATLSGVEVSAAGTFESEPLNEGTPGAPAAKVGVVAGSDTGVQAELEQSWEKGTIKAVTGMTPKVTEGGKVTTTGGELGIEAALEGENVTFKMGFTFIEVDKGEVKFATLKPGAEFPVKKDIVLPGGTKGKLEIKTGVTLNVQPDYAQIAQWLGETFGPELVVVAVPIAAGVAAAGFIGGTMYLMDDAHKRGIAAGNAAAAAGEHAKSFSDSFASVATGGGPAGGTGGAAGATAAEDTIKKQVGIRKAIVDKNKQKGKDTIAREAYVVIAQAIYDNAKTKYREQHKGDFWVGVGEVVGIEDFGSGLGAHMKPIAIVLENKSPGGGPLKLNE